MRYSVTPGVSYGEFLVAVYDGSLLVAFKTTFGREDAKEWGQSMVELMTCPMPQLEVA